MMTLFQECKQYYVVCYIICRWKDSTFLLASVEAQNTKFYDPFFFYPQNVFPCNIILHVQTTLSRTHLRLSAECRETITVYRCQKREVETKKSFLLSYIVNVYDISFHECSVENTLPCIIRTRSNSSSIYCTNNPSKMKASYAI